MKWDEMTPRERDALVAEKVMGWTKEVNQFEFGGYVWMVSEGEFILNDDWQPSTDISAAWKVVEKFEGAQIHHAKTHVHLWSAEFFKNGESIASGFSATAPEAICKTALKAVGVEVVE
jgi:hypothetical protein